MKPYRVCLTLLLLGLVGPWAGAQASYQVAWRSQLGYTRGLAIDTADHTLWVAAADELFRITPEGALLQRVPGFLYPYSVAVDPNDRSVWVADCGHQQLVHLSAEGQELWRYGPFQRQGLTQVAVDPRDGSVWATDTGSFGFQAIYHFAADGTLLLQQEVPGLHSVAVDPNDGSCWGATPGAVHHFSADGTELPLTDPQLLWGTGAVDLAVDPRDGSCWVVGPDGATGSTACRLAHLSADGTVLWTRTDLLTAAALSGGGIAVDPNDGSCWASDTYEVIHVASDGRVLWQGPLLQTPHTLPLFDACFLVDANDGSCWMALGQSGLFRLSADAQQLTPLPQFRAPQAVAQDERDGSCWVADRYGFRVVHLSAQGEKLQSLSDFPDPQSVSVYQQDGSCWVADASGFVVHLAADGRELWRGLLQFGAGVCVNQTDGSCWVTDRVAGDVIHLAADGSELSRTSGFTSPHAVSVDTRDGSCWVADQKALVHLAEDGTELWRDTAFSDSSSLSVDPSDGACWVGGLSRATLLSATGAVLRRITTGLSGHVFVAVDAPRAACWISDFYSHRLRLLDRKGAVIWQNDTFESAQSFAVHPRTRHVWVADPFAGQVTRLAFDGPLFTDVPEGTWGYDAIQACAFAGIVQGYSDGTYRPKKEVTRGQMAAYIVRAVCGGEANVPSGPAVATFSDVGPDYSFYDHIEYAVAHGVVTGYTSDNSYRPGEFVNRGQMAAFLARAKCDGEANVPIYLGTPSFPDVAPDFKFYHHIEYIYSQGITTGKADGLYHPEEVCLRDQMAVFIGRAFLGL